MSKYARKKLEDPVKRKVFIEALENLAFIDLACAKAGVSTVAYYNTIDSAEQRLRKNPNSTHWEVEFLNAVKVARLQAEISANQIIRTAAPDHWQAAAWYLERTRPKRYGRRAPAPAPEQDKLTAAKAVKDALDAAEQTAQAPIDEDY